MIRKLMLSLVLLISVRIGLPAQTITMTGLLKEMDDRAGLARFPSPAYAALQASSYNRESVARDAPGWFADGDGTGFIRTETIAGKQEWVVMEQQGPGAITRLWAPYFFNGGLDDLEGPEIRIYLDGSNIPMIHENFFKLITGRGSVPPPFARVTARAGDCYFPIPFAKGCKVTFDRKPFYYSIASRQYAKNVAVQTFTPAELIAALPLLDRISQSLAATYAANTGRTTGTRGAMLPNGRMELTLDKPGAITQMEIRIDPAQIREHPELLRSLVLSGSFDGENTVWVPLGDFFGSANALNPFHTWTRSVNSLGQMICTWVMPFRTNARLSLLNLSKRPVTIDRFSVQTGAWEWNDRSMHFHANWRPDELAQGSVFSDYNFIRINGKGVLAGDAWTVLNPDEGWWGEGDEKIYVDSAWDKKFPTQFGTGTEDYYGWAGGENPGKDDVFSHPYLANISVGSAMTKRQGTRGFDICTRVRALDAIPFEQQLVFDMEASPGVDIRHAWDYLGYSSVVFWYGRPGATCNRPPSPEKAANPIMTLQTIDSLEKSVKATLSN